MEINGVPFDKAQAIRDIAMEYTRLVMTHDMDCGVNPADEPQTCLDQMFELYVRSFGHLSAKSDEFVAALLESY